MKATGNGITIVIFDSDAHGDAVAAVARQYAPGAIVDYRKRGDGANIDYEAVRGELKEIAANPGRINIVQMSWGTSWIGETPPAWVYEEGDNGFKRGLEDELKALVDRGIYIVAAAGDDSQGGKIGANYPACSPHCIPAMGSVSFCNRTRRGLICSEDSASRAASELSAAIAMLLEAGAGDACLGTLEGTSDERDGFQALNITRALAHFDAEPNYAVAVEKHRWLPVESGRIEISVKPETKITRYKSDGKTIHWERFGSSVTTVEAGKEAVIGITGGVGQFMVSFRRAA